MTSETLVAPAWRLFDLARTATTLLRTLAVLAGCCARFTPTRPEGHARAHRLAVGGTLALLCVGSVEFVYRAISWAFAGRTDGLLPTEAYLPLAARSSALYAAAESPGTVSLSAASTVARFTAVSGLTALCLGCGLWAVSASGGPLGKTGFRGIALGFALLALSVGAELFAGINYAISVGWSA